MRKFGDGQPLKLAKPGVKERFLQAIDKGSSYYLACGYAGISFWTFTNWMKKGKKYLEEHSNDGGEPEYDDADIYYQFYYDVKKVESQAALKWLMKIDEASANGHWQAAAWKLERRYPKDYGKFEREFRDHNKNDDEVEQAKSEVIKLKQDDNGRSKTATN